VTLAIDFHEDLVEVPAPVRMHSHPIDPLAPDLGRKHRPEPVPPKTYRFMAEIDAALGQQVLDVAQRQRIFDVHHHHQPDHLL